MIADGKVVALSYVLKDDVGSVLDQATKEDPFYYLHGIGQIVPGLESALAGLKSGDTKEVVVPPEKGYGTVVEDLKVVVKRQQFPSDAEIKVGMQFLADMGNGAKHPFVVTNVIGDDIRLDGNHPLAGQTLHFSVEVQSIRDATEEEKTHGHAHAPGHSH